MINLTSSSHLWLIIGIIALAAILTAIITGWLRRYALARDLVDIPNRRSSHSIPTPRGGGVSVVLTFTAGLPLVWWINDLAVNIPAALLGAGAMVALVGFLDDQGHIPVRWRLSVHFLAAIWVLAWMGGLPPLVFFGRIIELGLAGNVLAALYLVWLLNLYNFMDGIDGIAGMEALTVCLGVAVLYGFTLPEAGDWVVPLLMACAVAGFLVWNFPLAKIFMGDAGSGFIGIILGAMSIHAAWLNPGFFWAWLILLGAFIVDATVTLARRGLRGEKIYEAHRSHAYQHAARKYGSHIPVTLAFAGINLVWLFPLALLVALDRLDGIVGVAIAYAPLVAAAFWFKAGMRE